MTARRDNGSIQVSYSAKELFTRIEQRLSDICTHIHQKPDVGEITILRGLIDGLVLRIGELEKMSYVGEAVAKNTIEIAEARRQAKMWKTGTIINAVIALGTLALVLVQYFVRR